MSEQEAREYLEFMYDEGNEYNCSQCPENRRELFARLPCGQQNCWVTCHIRHRKEGELWGDI